MTRVHSRNREGDAGVRNPVEVMYSGGSLYHTWLQRSSVRRLRRRVPGPTLVGRKAAICTGLSKWFVAVALYACDALPEVLVCRSSQVGKRAEATL